MQNKTQLFSLASYNGGICCMISWKLQRDKSMDQHNLRFKEKSDWVHAYLLHQLVLRMLLSFTNASSSGSVSLQLMEARWSP